MSRRLLLSYLSLAIVVLVALEVPLGVSYARNQRGDITRGLERDAGSIGSLAEDVLRHFSSDLREQNADVRVHVARALGDIKNPRFRALVVPLMFDANVAAAPPFVHV